MSTTRKPRAGSLQFWPRKRAQRMYPRVRNWADSKKVSLLGFGGYKVGMVQAVFKDNKANSMTKGQDVALPVTIIECPALKLFSVRFYSRSGYGSNVGAEVLFKHDKVLSRKVKLAKKYDHEAKLKEVEGKLDSYEDVRVLVYTQPSKTGLAKKKPEVFELAIGGSDVKAKFDYVKSLIGKEIKVSELFKGNTVVDIHAVSKGKGFQGALKRLGLTLRSHKSQKSRRTGNPGPEGYAKVTFTAPMGGQLGYNLRTEYNKDLLFVGDKSLDIKSGFRHYGNVKNDYVFVLGSVPGATKRYVLFTEPLRKVSAKNLELVSVRLKQ